MNNNPLLEARDVDFSYGKQPILSGVSLRVHAGETLSLIGASGSGKTTLLQILAGDLRPSAGAVTKRGLWRRVFQNQALFPWWTVEQNIRLGLRGVDAERALPFADLVKMLDLQKVLPLYPRQLSGGLRQRTEVARALIGRPDGLFLDEPFSNLDYILRREICDYLAEFLKKFPTAMLLVTHDIPEAVTLTQKSCLLSRHPATLIKTYNHSTSFPSPVETIWKDLREGL
jgi:NitT/TauT family transport system ATP-binding protein